MNSNINTHKFLKPNRWAQDLGQQSGLEAFAESNEGERSNSEGKIAKTNSLEAKRLWSSTDHLGGWIPTGIGQLEQQQFPSW